MRFTLLICATVMLAGCQRDSSVPMGSYRAVLTLPGGELPFTLELRREGDAYVGDLVNGREQVALREVQVRGSHLEIRMPGYENRLIADVSGQQLTGEVILDKLGGKQQHVPLRARLGEPYRFFAPPAAHAVDVSGRWAVNFVDDDGSHESAVGEFAQANDVVTGTFLTPSGDHRFLAGQVRGGELYLSTFDGAHAFLYHASLSPAGELAGEFWSGMTGHERWSGVRDAQAELADAYSLTTLRGASKHLEFAFPDLDGRLVTSNDARFRGKVLIVAIAGSWCPNCHDEAAFLAELDRQYRDRGLEIVSLMFEHFGDFAQAAEATRRFRSHYGIEYSTLIAGISDKDQASKALPMLNKISAFPTTIFIDRKGEVRSIHTGFSGPATGEHYTQFVGEVKTTLDELLAET
jgi:thiol-disulfide isomerase/thioredoxin